MILKLALGIMVISTALLIVGLLGIGIVGTADAAIKQTDDNRFIGGTGARGGGGGGNYGGNDGAGGSSDGLQTSIPGGGGGRMSVDPETGITSFTGGFSDAP